MSAAARRRDIRGSVARLSPHVALRAHAGYNARIHNFKQPISFSRRDFAPEV
jgi:hypothetical protein